MKIIVTIKTGKKNSTKQEIDKTVDMVLEVGALLRKKLNFIEGGCKIYPDGTSLILYR